MIASILLFIKANPFKAIKLGISIAGLLAICFIVIRMYNLSVENSTLRSTLKTQQKTISNLHASNMENERLSIIDAKRSVANEHNRTKILSTIENSNEKDDVALGPIMLDAYRSLCREAGNCPD